MTTAKRWLGTLARHYPSLLVSGVCHKALGEIEELEAQIAVITTTLTHYAALTAERDRLREALEMADRLLTSHAIASGKYWRNPFATRHEMTHGKIRAALKETSK